jgi:hypothetical protein
MTHHEKISTRKTDLQRGAVVDTRKPILLTKNKFQPKKNRLAAGRCGSKGTSYIYYITHQKNLNKKK